MVFLLASIRIYNRHSRETAPGLQTKILSCYLLACKKFIDVQVKCNPALVDIVYNLNRMIAKQKVTMYVPILDVKCNLSEYTSHLSEL
jgi:hypothetical protein